MSAFFLVENCWPTSPIDDLLDLQPNLPASFDQYSIIALLPPFIKPLPVPILLEDVNYLNTKGALFVLDGEIRAALIHAFVDLLLMQGVIFSAAAYVDMKYLHTLGFVSRKEARRLYPQRTKLLYDFGCESDRITVIQTLLFMTYWHETLDDEKDASHWIGIAIPLAETIGMNRLSGHAKTPEKKLWKRIWSACYIRDCLVSLGLRRPAKIRPDKLNMSMLEESDFGIQVLPVTVVVNPAECAFTRNIEMQSELAAMFVALAQLSLCISRLLGTQYSLGFRAGNSKYGTTKSTMMLFPKASNVKSIESLDEELEVWEQSLPSCCQNRTFSQADREHGRSTIVLHNTLLHMLYHAAVIALHWPSCRPFVRTNVDRQALSRLKVSEAAIQISQSATMLHSVGLDCPLPTPGVTVIMLAMVSHISVMDETSGTHAHELVKSELEQCIRV
ncbi:fungal-specific transcription factor domain-containing protein [Durotheca rogersii]|uniref:fungal-specific transcription factor domain-containing protein n=1 Tax=Durotheca rogersii TaxID=419775 RepID=UPI0022207345|nr:fungal-specific transcription factor domain-containing protein [Durotheca rogersii]KAI5867467.1 fungal-specific transcription factor domain-containing protein [Durotheca rogersii]